MLQTKRKQRQRLKQKRKRRLADVCWPGYEAIGMKRQGGRLVPNCAPISRSDVRIDAKRDSKNYALAKFSSGKRYNADLNGAQNIAARGILKLTRRNDREERSSKRSGRSPRSWACLCDLWDTAVSTG